MEPITRREQLLDSIATGDSTELEPITREEQYLSAIAGSTDLIPEKPITRKEMFYKKILESVGGGGDGTAKPEQTKTIEVTENGTYKITPDSGKVLSSATAKVNVPERYEEGFQAGIDSVKLQEKTVTENGDVLPDDGFAGMSKVTVAVPVSSGKEEQEKSITITENGTTEVIPDEGKTLSKVKVETSVAGSGEIGKPYIDTSGITNFYYFCYSNRLIDYLEQIDTSNGIKFTGMFYQSKELISIPTFDTSNGIYFNDMFYDCERLANIPPLNTSKGTGFGRMFYNCSALQTVAHLDTSKGTDFANMFFQCYNLKSVSITLASANLATSTFQYCGSLQNVTIGESWAVNIYLHYSNELTVESLHGMIENLADLTGKTAKTFQIGPTNLAKIDEAHINMLKAKNWDYK